MIELNDNMFTGKVPSNWQNLQNLEYLNLANNKFGVDIRGRYPIPILVNAQNLRGIDFSANEFEGPFPYEYFSETQFQLLEYVAVNFNKGVKVPDICARLAYCFKPTVTQGIDANQENFLETEIANLIDRSTEDFDGLVVDL